jgi:hypothetical protein
VRDVPNGGEQRRVNHGGAEPEERRADSETIEAAREHFRPVPGAMVTRLKMSKFEPPGKRLMRRLLTEIQGRTSVLGKVGTLDSK